MYVIDYMFAFVGAVVALRSEELGIATYYF